METPSTEMSRPNDYTLVDYVSEFLIESFPDEPLDSCEIYQAWMMETYSMQRQIVSTSLTRVQIDELIEVGRDLDDGGSPLSYYVLHIIEIVRFMYNTMTMRAMPRQLNFDVNGLRF